MKKTLYYCLAFVLLMTNFLISQPIIIDHNCIDISKVPDNYIIDAKSNLKITYGHTSHGSQITSGINLLARESGSIYTYNQGQGSLSYVESQLSGDLGNPNRTEWANKTRTLLNKSGIDRNMVMWSWCGQASTANEEDINTYLTLMDELEKDFPDVIFVYMTGHLDGTGESGNLNQRNNQIRDFCKRNNKILFDFADIESYDPDGNYFLDKRANDNCDYYEGNVRKNWADEWCNANPGKCGDCSCAHSKCLNCMMKGRAFWWMLARIEGWEGPDAVSVEDFENNAKGLSIHPLPASNSLEFEIADNPESYFSIEIIGITGQVLISKVYKTGVLNGSKFIIDISDLNDGIYFVKLSSPRNTIMDKFIKIE